MQEKITYYNEIKEILINNEINKRVKDYSKNKVELESYYNVGKLLVEAQGGEEKNTYGNALIKKYSIKLKKELNINYNERTLRRMRQFYLTFKNWSALTTELTISHYTVLMTIKDIEKMKYYINVAKRDRIGYRKLQKIIKEKEYERLPESTKEKLKNNEELSLVETIKDPILIKSNNIDINNIKEKTLQKLILDDLNNFLSQLGNGYTYVRNEYKIQIGNTYNYIDILLYNVIYHCYVVVELKVTPLKKEHIGQVEVYMNYIDYNVKNITDNKTIGLIVTKENNKYIIKYSSDKRIKTIEYQLT